MPFKGMENGAHQEDSHFSHIWEQMLDNVRKHLLSTFLLGLFLDYYGALFQNILTS